MAYVISLWQYFGTKNKSGEFFSGPKASLRHGLDLGIARFVCLFAM